MTRFPIRDTLGVARLLVTLLSCVFLAWSLQAALAGASLRQPAASAFTLTQSVPAGRNPDAKASEIWIRSVMVEGRLVPNQELVRTGAWADVDGTLVHRDDGQPATIRVEGRHVTVFFITSAWSGIVRIQGSGGATWDVDLYHPETEDTTVKMIDLAAGRLVADRAELESRPLRTAVALLPLLLIAWFWRPWRSAASLERWAIAYVGALHALVWLTQAVGFNSDSTGYLRTIADFAVGVPSYFPPGYPIFLGAVQTLIPAPTGLAVTAFQHALMVLALVAIMRTTRAFLPADLATAGFVFSGSLAPTLFLPQGVLSENLALAGMAGTLWLASRNRQDSRVAPDIVAGLPLGWAGLARVVPLSAMALPILLLRLAADGIGRRFVIRTASVFVGAIAPLILAAFWLWINSGYFVLAGSTNEHLYNRVVTEQVLLDRDGPGTQKFLSLVGDVPLHEVPHWDMTGMLERKGLSPEETALLMGDVAIEGMRRHPLQFVSYSVGMAWREYNAATIEPIPTWAVDVEAPSLEKAPVLGLRSSSILWRRSLSQTWEGLWPVLMWLPPVGLLCLPLLRSPLVFLAVLAIPAGYLFSTSLADFFLERHVLCVLPFALALAPAPVAGVLAAWQRLRGRAQT